MLLTPLIIYNEVFKYLFNWSQCLKRTDRLQINKVAFTREPNMLWYICEAHCYPEFPEIKISFRNSCYRVFECKNSEENCTICIYTKPCVKEVMFTDLLILSIFMNGMGFSFDNFDVQPQAWSAYKRRTFRCFLKFAAVSDFPALHYLTETAVNHLVQSNHHCVAGER